MKKEMIEKVVKAMMKYETVKVELLGLTEDERAKELAEFIYEDILIKEQENRIRKIEARLNEFAGILREDARQQIMMEEYSFASYKRYINVIKANWLGLALDLQELDVDVEHEMGE